MRPISPCDSAAQRSRWAQSGFANTDLDFQLKQHGVSHIIAVGLLANTCIESPGRFAMDFGYHVTLVRDATAAFSHEMMHAAHHLNGPTFAHSILTTRSYQLQANEHDNFAAHLYQRRGAMGEGFFRAVTAAAEESQFFAEY